MPNEAFDNISFVEYPRNGDNPHSYLDPSCLKLAVRIMNLPGLGRATGSDAAC